MLMAAGIDDISIYIPRLYLDAGDFAKARGLDPVKLERGLGIGPVSYTHLTLPTNREV